MKSFPTPLTSAEEQYYMQKYTEGDLEAKHILIEHNLRLVAHIVKKYQRPEEDNEDLISIGTVGLIKAVITFNPEKGNRLSTYAARCIENEILMMLRSRKKSSREISLYEPIGTDREGNEIQLFDVMETTDEDIHEKINLKDDVRTLYEKVESELSDRERLVLKMRYGLYNEEEYTQREIAKRLGISRSYALKKAPWKNCAASFRNLDRILRNRKQRLIFTENACRFRFPHHIILLSLPVFLKYHTALTAFPDLHTILVLDAEHSPAHFHPHLRSASLPH